MLIKIIDVSSPVTPPGKKYQVIEVSFKDESGSVKGKKLMSFTHPTVFNTVKDLVKGDQVEVTNVKEGDYWQWTAVNRVAEGVADSASNEAKTATQPFAHSSNDRYETKEERQLRQKYIIRQSSLSTAVDTLSVGAKSVDPDKVLGLARKYEAYVFETNPIQELVDMQDDLPD